MEFLAHTITTSKRGWLMLRLIEYVCFFIGVVIAVWSTYIIETRFFPVIKDWKLDTVIRQKDTYTLSGSMFKDRTCELISTNVMAVPKMHLAPRVLLYKIDPNDIDGGNAPVGHTTWGPWTMDIPQAFLKHRDEISFIEVVGMHRCHAFWVQETIYGTIRMEQLP